MRTQQNFALSLHTLKMTDKINGRNLLHDLFRANYEARKNKRSTINALAFEVDYETKLLELYEEIKNKKYEISRSICFISFHPIQREIFAADFRDRVVHHLVYNYIGSFFERLFIHDSYSCRIGKGTSYGVRRVDHFLRSCSKNYTQDCYILKLDISGYFMSMDRSILYSQVEKVLNRFRNAADFDVDFKLYLIRKIVFHDPTKNCCIKGSKNDWRGLPRSKSLFYAEKNKGFPIGNLTSQLFGNVYLNDFDHFICHKLGIKYYGRYVDDFLLIHNDKEYLKSIIPVLDAYLQEHLVLNIHPKKIYFQHFSKGVVFLGRIIKPYRIYISSRTKNGFYQKIEYWNKIIRQNKTIDKENLNHFLYCMNSYLGMLKHYDTYKLRKKILTQNLSAYFWNYVYAVNNYSKLEPKIKKIPKKRF